MARWLLCPNCGTWTPHTFEHCDADGIMYAYRCNECGNEQYVNGREVSL